MRATDLDTRTIRDALEVISGAKLSDTPYDQRSRAVRTYAAGRVMWDPHAREVYSYGRHFPLVRFVPRALNGGRRDVFVVNGDVWRGNNSRTRDHQFATRAAVADACAQLGGVSIVVPFSAVAGAGLELDSLRPIHVRDDAHWTETREARTLAELPRHERRESYSVERDAVELEWVPSDYRRTWRKPVAGDDAYGSHAQYLSILPDSDGRYRWRETRYRDRAPDPDGRYRWDVTIHRLGDALFSAVRQSREPTRDADAFEHERETARETVRLRDSEGRTYCTAADVDVHEAGPSAACIHCGLALRADVTYRRRARYLSSFDTNERPALYFLAQVPRGAGDTVETALDSLAPRAVHAALARGRDVRRQGDVFFIDTDLTREALADRGATFGRLTLWTRSATPRAGEPGYMRPATVAERRATAARELRTARLEWRQTFRRATARATAHDTDPDRDAARARRREENGAAWRALLDRQSRETAAVRSTGADPETALVGCETCGAAIGAACSRERLDGVELNGRTLYPTGATADGYCLGDGEWAGARDTLAERHARERSDMRRETRAHRPHASGASYPVTDPGGRRTAAIARERARQSLETARAALRRATLAGETGDVYARGYCRSEYWDATGRYVTLSHAAENRRRHADAVSRARANYADALARYRATLLVPVSGDRDAHRSRYGDNALAAWRSSRLTAALKHRPADIAGSPVHAAQRERVRRALAVYGTAHSASEVARVNGAVYVRGIVRHVPELIGETFRDADHAPLTLCEDRWYLAVRNAVPRQSRPRRRRRAARAREASA